MAMKYIYDKAGLSKLQRLYQRLHEPRFVSAMYGLAYAGFLIFGAYSVIFPPVSTTLLWGHILMPLIAGTLAVGGLIGVITVASGTYWAERTAVGFTLLGLTAYLATTIGMQIVGDGNRGLHILAIFVSIIGMIVRTYFIRDRPYNPRKWSKRR